MGRCIIVHHLPRPKATCLLVILLATVAPVVGAFAQGTPRPPSAAALLTPAEEERIISSLPVVPPGLNKDYALETRPSKKVSTSYTFSVKATKLTAEEWEIFAAFPPNLP